MGKGQSHEQPQSLESAHISNSGNNNNITQAHSPHCLDTEYYSYSQISCSLATRSMGTHTDLHSQER